MGRKQSKKRRGFFAGEGLSFVISLISVSVICIFVGYLLGQYALEWLNSPFTSVSQNQMDALNHSINSQLENLELPNSQTGADTAVGGQTQSSQTESPPAQTASSQAGGFYRVQAGVFNHLSNAEAQVALLRDAGFEAFITPGPPYRVQTGAFSTLENAERYANELKAEGFEVAVIRP